ncbi:MAG: aminotransferase class IV [Spirochaetaceae bacterium]
MGSAFTLSVNPWVYIAKYNGDGTWTEEFIEKPHETPEKENALADGDHDALLTLRNSFPELPLVNYTTQYGLGCFEGLKALPQPDGSIKVFRPDQNARRMHKSMIGLRMPAFPEQMFLTAVEGVVRRNFDLGFYPRYNPAWADRDFVGGSAMYIRPFTYGEPGIGLNTVKRPWVVIVTTTVGSYFDPDADAKAVTTNRIRATENGTGWIKCDANYVIPILAKQEAIDNGYMEAIFLDARERKYVEEGSSCNIFFYMKDGTLVTPSLEERILDGITRRSVLQLASDMNVPTAERPVEIEEALSQATEVFVTGTAAGVSHIESITHNGRTAVYSGGKIGELTQALRKRLRGIQYGAVEDSHGWLYPV